MELLNPHPRRKNWLDFLPGRWRLLYCTGRHIGLTLRQSSPRVLIGNVDLTFSESPDSDKSMFSLSSDISFSVMPTSQWPHNKTGIPGSLHIEASVRVATGRRLYLGEEDSASNSSNSQESIARKISNKRWKGLSNVKEPPFGLPAAKLVTGEIDVEMSLDPSSSNLGVAESVLREVRIQIPPEMFDVSKLVCGTYVDSRLMVLRGVNGSALLFTRSCPIS